MKSAIGSVVLASLMLFGTQAFAATQTAPAASSSKPVASHCRDAKGKFIKCATAAPAKKTCRDASGKFAKCAP